MPILALCLLILVCSTLGGLAGGFVAFALARRHYVKLLASALQAYRRLKRYHAHP